MYFGLSAHRTASVSPSDGCAETVRYRGPASAVLTGNHTHPHTRRGVLPGTTWFLLQLSTRLSSDGPGFAPNFGRCGSYYSGSPPITRPIERLVGAFGSTNMNLQWELTQRQRIGRLSYPLTRLLRGQRVAVSLAAKDVPFEDGGVRFTGRVQVTLVPVKSSR